MNKEKNNNRSTKESPKTISKDSSKSSDKFLPDTKEFSSQKISSDKKKGNDFMTDKKKVNTDTHTTYNEKKQGTIKTKHLSEKKQTELESIIKNFFRYFNRNQ